MKTINSIVNSLSQRDREALYSIYQFRCLTQAQIYALHYVESLKTGQNISDLTCRKRITHFESNGLIKCVKYDKYNNYEAYFLTTLGIDVLRSCFNISTIIYNERKNNITRGYYRASDLEISPMYIPHQVNLNQFVVDFKSTNPNTSWRYYDEKYVSQYTQIRPDGLITLLDTDFFLEMDMSTESKNQLFEKWDNYRRFVASSEFALKERKIIVLFIVEGAVKHSDKDIDFLTNKVNERIPTVRYTIYERILDLLGDDFDVFVGTKDELVEYLTQKFIPAATHNCDIDNKIKNVLVNKHGFYVDAGETFKQAFDVSYQKIKGKEHILPMHDMYIRKLNTNNTIRYQQGKLQEFLVDNYYYSPASVINKIVYHTRENNLYQSLPNGKRNISQVVIVDDLKEMYKDLLKVNMIETDDVYFTTLERLEAKSFHEALCKISATGNLYSFTDAGLKGIKNETNIRD